MTDPTPKIIVLSLPGTGFSDSVDPITADFHSRLDSSRYETRVIRYPASFGGTEPSFEVSRAAGNLALFDALEALPPQTPVVISGYSQGAVIAGDVARQIATENMVQYNVVGCALIADGYRPAGEGLTLMGYGLRGVAEGYGIAGQRRVPYGRYQTFWVSAWGDPICSLPAGNPLRTVADLAIWYGLKSPGDLSRWGAMMLDGVIAGRLQDWWAPWKWAGWAGALRFARGYLFDGRHTHDYIRLGYTKLLADRLNELAVTGD